MSRLLVNRFIDRAEAFARLPDPAWKGLYRLAGICLLITGPLYLCGAVLSLIIGGPPPSASALYMQALARHVLLSQINFGIFILTDFLLLPVVAALYFCLKPLAKTAALVAAGLLLVYLLVDIAVTEMNSVAIVILAQQYAAAGSEAQQAVYLSAAAFGLATLPLATFFSYGVSCLGWLIINIVMLKSGIFNRLSAFVGFIFCVEGIAGSFYVLVPDLALLLAPCLIAFGLWCLLVGARLLQLGRQLTQPVEQATAVPSTN